MIDLVISGGQTGVDQAGWRAAKKAGIPTGGWMPRGFLTEDGNDPELSEMFGAKEHPSSEYPPRTHANAAWSDVTLWFGSSDSRGFGCTANGCRKAGKPIIKIVGPKNPTPEKLADAIRLAGYKIINVAGNRESSKPGIGGLVEDYLDELFILLGHFNDDVSVLTVEDHKAIEALGNDLVPRLMKQLNPPSADA